MKYVCNGTTALLHSASKNRARPWKSPSATAAVRLALIGMAGYCLLAMPGSALAQFSESASPAFVDYSAPDCSLNAGLRQNSDQNQENQNSQEPQGAQGKDQTQNQTPPTNNEPSLKDLGFPTDITKGNKQDQARLDKRSHMLQVHQRLGLIAVAPMVASLISSSGAKEHHGVPGSPGGRELHAILGAATGDLYFTSAYYAIRAPKIPGTRVEGPIRVHKALAWIHGPGMILTPILGAIAYSQESKGEKVHGIAKYHSDVALITAAAYGAAIISVSFKF
ncbi:MAG TPA: hypothetical protein VKV95_06815 [Terriglobia bacterium]|nr:hypothetical protein [Terriglobia bacterium]